MKPTKIDLDDASKLWHSATAECRATWAKAADLPKMPSELLLVAKDKLIGQALAKWGQDICELVVGLRNELKAIREAKGMPEEPEFKRLRSGIKWIANDADPEPVYSEYCMKSDYTKLRAHALHLQNENERLKNEIAARVSITGG